MILLYFFYPFISFSFPPLFFFVFPVILSLYALFYFRGIWVKLFEIEVVLKNKQKTIYPSIVLELHHCLFIRQCCKSIRQVFRSFGKCTRYTFCIHSNFNSYRCHQVIFTDSHKELTCLAIWSGCECRTSECKQYGNNGTDNKENIRCWSVFIHSKDSGKSEVSTVVLIFMDNFMSCIKIDQIKPIIIQNSRHQRKCCWGYGNHIFISFQIWGSKNSY